MCRGTEDRNPPVAWEMPSYGHMWRLKGLPRTKNLGERVLTTKPSTTSKSSSCRPSQCSAKGASVVAWVGGGVVLFYADLWNGSATRVFGLALQPPLSAHSRRSLPEPMSCAGSSKSREQVCLRSGRSFAVDAICGGGRWTVGGWWFDSDHFHTAKMVVTEPGRETTGRSPINTPWRTVSFGNGCSEHERHRAARNRQPVRMTRLDEHKQEQGILDQHGASRYLERLFLVEDHDLPPLSRFKLVLGPQTR